MRLSLLSAGAVALTVIGCAADLAPSGGEPGPNTGISGPDATIAFTDGSTLAVEPGKLTTLSVQTDPPDHYEVAFLLLGDSLDATLDKSIVVADAEGNATVTLRAPNQATTFRLKASIKDGPSAELPVSVSDAGFGTLRVIPVYGGHREVQEWTAAAVAKRTCAEIASQQPGDPQGALIATAPGESSPEITSAPVGPNLAITLRAGHYIWGCADETRLAANETLDVHVTVFDKPLDLSVTDLSVAFDFTVATGSYEELLMDGAQRLAEAAFPTAQPEWETLLDEIEAHVDQDDLVAFQQSRQSSFDMSAAAYFSGLSPSLHTALHDWATAGIVAQPSTLSGRLRAIDTTVGHALLNIERFGDASATEAGIPADHLVSWSAQPGDVVLLGGTILWQPSRFAGSAAAPVATLEHPTASNVAEALDVIVDCDALAAALGPFGACEIECYAALCRTALHERYETGLAASAAGGALGTLSMAATGDALVSDEATPISFAGDWVGIVSVGPYSVGIGGAAMGEPYGDSPP